MIRYRQATQGDTADFDRVVRAAYNALSRRHGFAEIPPGPPLSLPGFAIAEKGEGCWVAEEERAVVGVAIANRHEPLWCLATLFVDPVCQEAGVGRELLRRALAHGGHDAAIRALITFAYNPVSIGLYLRYGMLPVEPLYVQESAADAAQQRLAGREKMPSKTLTRGDGGAELLAAIDAPILGINRVNVHRYLLQLPGNVCYVFEAGGEPRGYAYISVAGRVGPVAAAAPLSFERVFETALIHAATTSRGQVSVLLPGSNGPAMRLAIEAGMRIVRPMLLMASRRFADLDRYAFHSPGIM
jgi:GNAT superfamily N-acetyltransferase